MHLAAALFLVFATGSAAHAAGAVSRQAVAEQEDQQTSSRAERLARDARITFSPTAALRARNDLAAGLPAGHSRAVALMALACGGAMGDLVFLEEQARAGTERRAAVLALGEMGPGAVTALLRLCDEDGAAEVASALCVALLRSRASEATARLRDLAQVESSLSAAARSMGPFLDSRDLPALAIVDELFDLRWQAGRHYGRVDGRRRRAVLIQELADQRDFLDRALLEASVLRDSPAVTEHLLEMVAAGRGVGCLWVAAVVLPSGLAGWIRDGSWQPASMAEWRGMLAAIDQHDREYDALDLLQLAFEKEELAAEAGLLILRAGGALPERWIERELATADTARRSLVLEALGERGDVAAVPSLVAYLNDDPEPRVRAAALVGLRRLGSTDAQHSVEETLTGEADAMRRALVIALARTAPADPQTRAHLRDAARLGDLDPDARFAVDLALVRLGMLTDRALLRRRIPAASPDERRMLVRALADGAEQADIEIFRRMFPVEGDLDVNVDLAVALIRHRDRAMSELLRRILWRSEWNQSVLAGGLLIRAGGMHTLLDELAIPPSTASERDRRRVGFALGQWAGMSAVEALARRQMESDAALQGAYLGVLATRRR